MLSFGTVSIFWDWRSLRIVKLQGLNIKSWWILCPKIRLRFTVLQEIWSLQFRVLASSRIHPWTGHLGDLQYLELQRSKWNSWRCSRKGMDFNFGGMNIRLRRWTSDTCHAVQLLCSEHSCNMSPWENDPKSKMVKPILIKPIMLDQGHARLPQWKISDIEDQ